MGIDPIQNPSAAAPRHMTYFWVKEPEADVSKPGVHYHVVEELNNHPDYVVFPDIPVLRQVFAIVSSKLSSIRSAARRGAHARPC